MEKDENKLSLGLAVIVSLISIPILIFYGAYTLATLWAWFIVPLGVPAIGLAHAMGITAVKSYFFSGIMKNTHKKAETSSEIWSNIAYAYLVPTFLLIFGSIYHSFM